MKMFAFRKEAICAWISRTPRAGPSCPDLLSADIYFTALKGQEEPCLVSLS